MTSDYFTKDYLKPSEALKPELKEVEVQVDNNELETLRGDLQAFLGSAGVVGSFLCFCGCGCVEKDGSGGLVEVILNENSEHRLYLLISMVLGERLLVKLDGSERGRRTLTNMFFQWDGSTKN